jgi:hypothetical protein
MSTLYNIVSLLGKQLVYQERKCNLPNENEVLEQNMYVAFEKVANALKYESENDCIYLHIYLQNQKC